MFFAQYTTDPVVGADFVYDVANYFNEMTTNPNHIVCVVRLLITFRRSFICRFIETSNNS